MKSPIFFACFFMSFAGGVVAQPPTDFTLGFADSLQSSILGEQRQVLVYTPFSGKTSTLSTNETYPVLYVLDGETNFRSVAATVERLASFGVCPPMIVVGIPNTNRGRDLTPSAAIGNNDGIRDAGGGEKFLSFIEKELIPYIDASYPTAPYKLLMGHSLGGLMVIQTLVHHNHLFNAYISIDASIWWDNHKILTESKSALGKNKYQHKTLFLTIANRMEKGVDTTAVQSDTAEDTELIRYNLDLIHFINHHPQSSLRFNYAYYEHETHGSVFFISAYDALRFIFDCYAFPGYALYTPENPKFLSLLTNHYRTISSQMGYEVLPRASLINSFGYRALNSKSYDMARQLFEWNVLHYPQDANIQDSFGDYYLAIGDKQNAIHRYQKSLAITEVGQTREKLNTFLKEK